MTASNLSEPATADLQGVGSVGEMARRESWSPDKYAVALAENIRRTDVPLDCQRERLAALAQVGAGLGLSADQAAADALAQHYVVLEALHQRFARQAFEALNQNGTRAAEVADKYLSASLKAQRAAMVCLSSLKVLRDAQRVAGAPTAADASAPTMPTPGARAGRIAESGSFPLSGQTDC